MFFNYRRAVCNLQYLLVNSHKKKLVNLRNFQLDSAVATRSIALLFAPLKTQSITIQRNFSVSKHTNANDIFNKEGSKYQRQNMENKSEKVTVNKEELKKRLTPLQYQVTQEAATERPFTGCYNKHYEKGIYQCIVCHQDLFSSDTKYDAGCGWPAFNDVLDKGKITLHRDASIPGGNILLLIKHPERIRTEVRCARCNAHMGHVFEDGPKPTRKRYCINSAAIQFISADELNSFSGGRVGSVTSPTTITAATPIAQQQ